MLQALVAGGANGLLPHMRETHLQKGETVVDENATPQTIYFPGTAVLSAVKVMADGREVEVATHGYEGASGLLPSLSSSIPTLRTFTQIAGSAFAIDAGVLAAMAHRDEQMMQTLLRSLAIAGDQTEQTVACLALHDVPARAARWILLTQDRVSADEFPLTQENLAIMIGAQRTTVNAAAMLLKTEGLIAYSRGAIKVVHREGLRRRACECYQPVEERWRGDLLALA